MSSIFNKSDNDAIIARINSLTTESKALWGKMTVDQMCKHCTSAINVAFDKQDVKVNFLMRFLGKTLKSKVFNSEFKKNSPTAKEFVFTNQYDLEIAKKEFIESFSQFAQGHQAIKIMDHPFWGKMTYEDWDKLMWKHVDHHLKQFGV
ncbi:DUF1569 domain-containing protein [Flavobacterium praedii]|uniref:DUF1569 domain-containing protein n=1 Tax=Flavobacterium praedii TaxID=3002900 RepID=UPI002481D133|nr:DUF1569 domain-containing protein [Flavobacterium praedii]